MQKTDRGKNIDIGRSRKQQAIAGVFSFAKKNKNKSILYSRGKKSDSFFTEDSKLYITPREQNLLLRGFKLDRKISKWDSVSSRVVKNFVRYQPSQTSLLLEKLEERRAVLGELTEEAAKNFVGQFSVVRLWNLSIVGSILFGMVAMTFVYRYLGQGAEASNDQPQQIVRTQEIIRTVENTKGDAESFAREVMEIQKLDDQRILEEQIREMVKGYPIENMAELIAQQDRTVAAFIVAIGKKESAWGKRVPVLDGRDCYNYWGYRGQRKLMGTGGHTCFDSPEDAVKTVARRIETLVKEKGKDTPAKMVLWKCGSNCDITGGQAAANKWISDVAMYFNEINDDDKKKS